MKRLGFVLLAACGSSVEVPPTTKVVAVAPTDTGLRRWAEFHCALDEGYTTDPVDGEVRADGTIRFHHGLEDTIDTMTDAPAELMTLVDEIDARGISQKVPVGLSRRPDAPSVAPSGPPDPARERRACKLIVDASHAPRQVLPCPAIDGATPFSVRVVYSKGGRAHEVFATDATEHDEAISKTLAPASRSDHPDIPPTPSRKVLSAAEVAKLRAALVALDLGSFHDLPTSATTYVNVEIYTDYNRTTCGRQFAPGLPASGAALAKAVDEIVATMW
ncbi:MAG: hypothetical protein K8W52_33760 [Deltaproteobacteria bacterium]|nr:hypothetical protein [Deltaproteobacteria bacterium]